MDLAAASGISIHAPHTRSDPYRFVLAAFPWGISIHAPHARSDEGDVVSSVLGLDISIHAPHARSDLTDSAAHHALPQFQSTLLMRGATSAIASCKSCSALFQSTLLMRGATAALLIAAPAVSISIHAPHARSDPRQARSNVPPATFQSTLLMRGATCTGTHRCGHRIAFQSTLLMRGATPSLTSATSMPMHFNPRSSCEERPQPSCSTRRTGYFNPRSSCEERRQSC